jgi:hypothetical protein
VPDGAFVECLTSEILRCAQDDNIKKNAETKIEPDHHGDRP